MYYRSRNLIPRRLKFTAWINIAIQISFPLVSIFIPMVASAFTEDRNKHQKPLSQNNKYFFFKETQAYTLQIGETTRSIAEKYHINLQQLQQLNQFRTFAYSFENIKPGTEIDIPTSPLSPREQENLRPIVAPEASTENQLILAQFVSKTGQFFTTKPTNEKTKAFARELVTTTASSYLQDWFNHFGSSQIKLEADKKFSLKNSQIDLLLPLYETENNLLFTQTSLHRKEGRIETNLGLGTRWYGENQMIGGNSFFDYDISRKHSRLGLGVEYRRDFLKLSANSYHRLSGWRNSRDLADYSTRPANGWDLRAEGWLPIYPHIGGKLTYEQFYGEEAALFGTKNRQNNPYSITAGINYTPIPLITLNGEHRQGKASKQDSRIGLKLSYQFGKSFKQHLDPDAVGEFRSLMGNRYDFVSRNNHILLDYKKNDTIYLNMNASITGISGEKIPLKYTINSQYGFNRINWHADNLVAAGGQVIDEKNGAYSIILPTYKSGGKVQNRYTINAVAVDSKGNISPNAILQVQVTQPTIFSANSPLTPTINLVTNGTPAFTGIKDKDNKPASKLLKRADPYIHNNHHKI
ncbi:inverse autotransporter beta domain-containing protein [Providencia alcalifaciens]|uniref:inverse autotransporter beta domain-containing protein n=3 Tax=Enterobacterales TaxID=91347 RepID=UPI00044DEE8E|nr:MULTISPECIES: inverse autotransporter beta domain-containing protein [Providencia]EUD07451.1 PF11924 family protein [Providencia alcalifaciens R90-1475]QLQ97691.1 inverse autotransporter beta domain-containing protein [Providencia alcalifaciens]